MIQNQEVHLVSENFNMLPLFRGKRSETHIETVGKRVRLIFLQILTGYEYVVHEIDSMRVSNGPVHGTSHELIARIIEW